MKKQFVTTSLMLVLVLLSQCLYASIDECSVLTDDDVVMDGNTIVEYKAKGVKTQIIIPNTLQGVAVEAVSDVLFHSCNLTEVHLPTTLKTVGRSTFTNNKLISITIPSNVITIGVGAFSSNELKNLVFADNSKLQTIQAGAFSRNDIASVILPESLVYFGADVFFANAYETINFPRSGQEWMDHMGNSYTGGESIPDLKRTYIIKNYHTMTDDDVVVEEGVITQCTYDFSSTCITIPNVLDGQMIKGIGASVFIGKNVLNVVLPDSLELIDSMAFRSCMIQELQLPKALKHVGVEAFVSCFIRALSIPDGSKMEYVGAYAFSGNSISSINMSQEIRYIGEKAFSGNLLTEISFPSSLRHIGAAAFNGNKISTLNGEDFNGVFYALNSNGEKDISKVVSFGRSDLSLLDIPEGVVAIGEKAFEQCASLANVTFPSSLKRIEERAFMSSGIKALDFSPTQLIYLGELAFNQNNSLSTINFEGCELLDTIPYSCFNSARSITSLNLNACTGLKYIGERAFSLMSRLTSFEMDSCIDLQCIEKDAFMAARKLSGFKLPISDSHIWSWGDVILPDGEAVSDYSVRYAVKKRVEHTVDFFDWDSTVILTDTIMTGRTIAAPAVVSREGYTFMGWDDVSFIITKDSAFTAQYQINSYAVKFLDWNKNLLLTDSVTYMNNAKAPMSPSRDGYNYVGWDMDFTNVKSDIEVNAMYDIISYKVTFMGWDNQVLAIDSVQYGNAALSPSAPSRDHYNYVGWDKDFANVKSDLEVKALYEIESYKVTFMDWDNQILATESVQHGGTASVPSAPSRDHYNFMGWDKDFANVESGLEVNALYQIVSYKVTFMDWDNQIFATDSVPYGSAAKEPNTPSRNGYTFIGWSTTFDSVTSDLIVFAQYSETAPVEEVYGKLFKVYPNPAKSTVVVESMQGEMISLYSLCGELIISVMVQNDKTIIDVNHLASGVYIIQKDGVKQKLV